MVTGSSRAPRPGRRGGSAAARTRTRRRPRTSSSTTLSTIRPARCTAGSSPAGSAGRARSADAGDRGGDERDDDRLEDEPGEDRVRDRAPIALSTPYSAGALDGEQREEQRDDDECDHDGDPEDLVEGGALFGDAGDRVDRVRDRERLDPVAERIVDRCGERGRFTDPSPRTTIAWNTPSASTASGRFRRARRATCRPLAHSPACPLNAVLSTQPITVIGVRAGPTSNCCRRARPRPRWRMSSAQASPGPGGAGTPSGASS